MANTHGTPVNTKSLLALIFDQMGKLDRGEIDANVAVAQSKLASQACNILNYELKRTIVQIRLREMFADSRKPELREAESKTFDDTINEIN